MKITGRGQTKFKIWNDPLNCVTLMGRGNKGPIIRDISN